ncbi:MAG: TfuA-like protein [Bacteroidota bacterium]
MVNQEQIRLYAGPSLTPRSRELAAAHHITLCPPIRRGEVDALRQQGYQGVIIIADGIFHLHLPVGHAELRDALRSGIRIFGLSSMGAIRAYEMIPFGMVGYGRVFQYFTEFDDFQDDEVAMLHTTEEPFKMLSEPMVHLRVAIGTWVSQNILTQAQGDEMINHFKNLYFGDRTLSLLRKLLKQCGVQQVSELVKNFDQYRIKNHDLESFLVNRVWTRTAFISSKG